LLKYIKVHPQEVDKTVKYAFILHNMIIDREGFTEKCGGQHVNNLFQLTEADRSKENIIEQIKAHTYY
jgi:hypothetical protein